MLDNVLKLVNLSGNTIKIDESKIDLFEYYDEPIPDWQPKITIPPFHTLKQAYFDIETTGLDPDLHEVKLTGVVDGNDSVYIWEGRERIIINEFFEYVSGIKPEILSGYNNFDFDLPFIIRRAEILGITHPFWVSPQPTTFRTAIKFNEPAIYHDIYVNGRETAIIDLYHQVLAWDFVRRKLLKYGLKTVPVDLGLRQPDDRIYLSYKQMCEIYDSGDLTLLRQYLEDDLKDTKLVGQYLIPDIYYQKLFLTDWSLQKISNKGNGRKWNDIISYEYKDVEFEVPLPIQYRTDDDDDVNATIYAPLPNPDPSLRYEGGYTYGQAGLFLKVGRGDLASMYPNLMLTYGICSRKDFRKITLAILKYLTTARLEAKAKAKLGDSVANQFQNTIKILINSCYGALASQINFNDTIAAAIVTAYGRALIKYINGLVERFSGKVIANDTDSVTYVSDEKDLKDIHAQIQENLPKGAKIELEWVAKAIFIPPAKDGEGLRKNYIIFFEDGTVKASGKYRKRDRCSLEKNFQINYLKKLIWEGRQSADTYWMETIQAIKNGTMPIEEITITRNAKKNEKLVYERNLVDDDGIVSYYFVDDVEVMKTKTKAIITKGNTGAYSTKYYLDLIREMYGELSPFVKAVNY